MGVCKLVERVGGGQLRRHRSFGDPSHQQREAPLRRKVALEPVNDAVSSAQLAAQETSVPHAYGILTCDSLEQAIDRAGLKSGNKGFEAGLSAVEMAGLKKVVSRQSSVGSKTRKRKARRRK